MNGNYSKITQSMCALEGSLCCLRPASLPAPFPVPLRRCLCWPPAPLPASPLGGLEGSLAFIS